VNLSESVGSTMMLQFRSPLFLCAPGHDGRPSPIMHNLPEDTLKQMAASGTPPFASALFLVCKVESASSEHLVVRYETDAAPGCPVKLTVPADMVIFASATPKIESTSMRGITPNFGKLVA